MVELSAAHSSGGASLSRRHDRLETDSEIEKRTLTKQESREKLGSLRPTYPNVPFRQFWAAFRAVAVLPLVRSEFRLFRFQRFIPASPRTDEDYTRVRQHTRNRLRYGLPTMERPFQPPHSVFR